MVSTEDRLSFRVGGDSSAQMRYTALASLDDINAALPPVALLSLLFQHTHDAIKPSPPCFTPHFVIFTPDGGMAYFLI